METRKKNAPRWESFLLAIISIISFSLGEEAENFGQSEICDHLVDFHGRYILLIFRHLGKGICLQWGYPEVFPWDDEGAKVVYEGCASRRYRAVGGGGMNKTERNMPSKGNSSLSWIMQGVLEHNCTWTFVPTWDRELGFYTPALVRYWLRTAH